MAQWEVERATGRSTVSGRPLEEGEEFYSVLLEEGETFRRVDYGLDEWEGPPEGAFCHFRTRMPIRQKRKRLLVDDEVLLAFFTRLARETEPVRVQFRFVLALILMRKRLLKYEGTEQREGQEVWRMLLTRDRSQAPGGQPPPERRSDRGGQWPAQRDSPRGYGGIRRGDRRC